MTEPTVVYVACAESRDIHCFNLDAGSGRLSPLDVVSVPGGSGPSPSNLPLALTPDRSSFYAASRSPPFAATKFGIDAATGRLKAAGSAPLPAAMAYLCLSRDGRLLMSASYVDGKISLNAITPNGVKAPPSQLVTTPPKAHCIIPGHGNVVYATTLGGDAIMIFHLNARSGRFVQASPQLVPCRPGSGPRHLALHPQLQVLYCVNELAGTLAVFAIQNETGALRAMQYEALTPAGFTGNARAADLHVTPDGRFAYASVRETNAIAAFRVDPRNGLLARIALFDVVASPRAFALDSRGRFLICAGQTNNVVAVYEIDQDNGRLTPRHEVTVGANPSWVETLALSAAS
jgi:6-phosphogluconolactonase